MLALTTVECGHRRASQSLRGRLSEVQQKGLFSRLVSFYAFLPLPSLPPWTQLEGPHRLCCFFPLLCCKFVLLQLLEWIKAVSLTAQYCRLNFDHWNSLRVWFCLKKKTKKHHPFFLYFACKIRFYFCGWWCFGLYFAFQNRPENDFSWCGVNVNEVAILWEPCEVSQVWSCLIPISSTCVYPCACEENGHKSFAFFLQWHWYYRSLSLSYKCSHQSVVCFYVSATEWHIALSSVRVSPLYFCSDSVFLMQVECKA